MDDLNDDEKTACEAILARCEAGELSAPIAVMEMLIVTEDASLVQSVVDQRAANSPKIAEVARLIERNASGCMRVAEMLRSDMDTPPRDATVEQGVEFCRRLFDWSVRQSEEASVALYSLGDPELLATATHEAVVLLDEWGVLGNHKEALEIGCGIGRMEEALSPHLARVVGVDVSAQMIAAGLRRCAHLENVLLQTCSGLDLRDFDAGRFDLVFAVDSFPYLVQSGMKLVDTHFSEAARVLRSRGDLVILNFSYREDEEADRRDVAALAELHGFEVRVAGVRPFSMWNGLVFHLKKRQTNRPSSRR